MKEHPLATGYRILRHRLNFKHSCIDFSKVRKIPIDSDDAFTAAEATFTQAVSNSNDYASLSHAAAINELIATPELTTNGVHRSDRTG